MSDNKMIRMSVDDLYSVLLQRQKMINISRYISRVARFNKYSYDDGCMDGASLIVKTIIRDFSVPDEKSCCNGECNCSKKRDEKKKQILEKLETLRHRGLYTRQDLDMMEEIMKEIKEF